MMEMLRKKKGDGYLSALVQYGMETRGESHKKNYFLFLHQEILE